MTPAVGLLCAGDLAHGVMEGQAEHLDMEVNGVAGQIAFGPAPVTVFDDEAGVSGQNKIAGLVWDELESVFFKQRNQWGDPGGADLFAGPADVFKQWVGHSLFSSGVG